jgi:hypothetical protein
MVLKTLQNLIVAGAVGLGGYAAGVYIGTSEMQNKISDVRNEILAEVNEAGMFSNNKEGISNSVKRLENLEETLTWEIFANPTYTKDKINSGVQYVKDFVSHYTPTSTEEEQK